MVTEAAPRKTKRANATPAELPAATPEAPIRAVRKTALKTAVAATTMAAAGREKPAAKTVVRKVANTAAADKAAAADSREQDAAGKAKKAKLVRDSFTMPAAEYELIATMKKRCHAKGLPAKKSQILRAAIIAFAAQGDAAINKAVAALPVIKTGRPAKAGK